MNKKLIIVLFLFVPAVVGSLSPVTHTAFAEEILDHKSLVDFDFPGLKNKISLDIRDMDMITFLKFLAGEGNLNIIPSKLVTGNVNLLINGVSVGDALEIVLLMNKFAYEVRDNVILIFSNEEYKARHGVDGFDQRETVIYQLKYASAKNVGAMLANVKSEIGKVIFDESTGTVVMVDTPAKLREMKLVIGKQDFSTITRVVPRRTRIFELKYAKADDLKGEIGKVITPDVGEMRVDTRTNTIIVIDVPNKVETVQKMIDAFDRKTREVFIEARIVEVNLSDKFEWGIDWDTVITMAQNGVNVGMHYPAGLSKTLSQFTFKTLNNNKIRTVVQVLSTFTQTRILSNPHLIVEEGKEASIKVIEHQPYQEQTTTTASGGTTTAATTYQWVDVGVTLNVTPKINKDGYISMLIKPEVSSISTWYGGAPQAAGSVPVVKSANASTTVTIKDGVTILIAGLIKDGKVKTERKFPILGDIPLISKAFKNTVDEITRTETVVFLTPRIVGGDKPFMAQEESQKPVKGPRASPGLDDGGRAPAKWSQNT